MNFDFPLILSAIVFATGCIWLFVKIWVPSEKTWLVDQLGSLFPILLVVLIIRSFIVQPYRVPTPSLEPTVMPGDLVAVTQYNYGLRLPVSRTKILNVSNPKRGDIVLFHWPVNHNVLFIKRLIGIPGDHISYINKELFINGKPAKQTFVGYATDTDGVHTWRVKKMQENLLGVKHDIYLCSKSSRYCPNRFPHNFINLVVPKGEYFMMGDNRDDSDDSRDWGFVPTSDLVGKGQFVWMNWDSKQHAIHWHRIGTKL